MLIVFKTTRDADFAVIQFAKNKIHVRRGDNLTVEIPSSEDGLQIDIEALGLEGITTIII